MHDSCILVEAANNMDAENSAGACLANRHVYSWVPSYLQAASSNHSCKNFPHSFFTLVQSNFSMKRRPLRDVMQESATKVRPHENSSGPSPSLILGSVPCDLWMVTAHAGCKGS